jgi:hypothetical protein
MSIKVQAGPRELAILKNLSQFNPGLAVKPGRRLETINSGKSVIVHAEVAQEYGEAFAVADLSRLLSVMSLVGADSTLTAADGVLQVEGTGRRKSVLAQGLPEAILQPPESLSFPAAEVSVTIAADVLADALKGVSIMKATTLSLVGDSGRLVLRASMNSDVYDVDAGETDKVFDIKFTIGNLGVLPGDYRVEVSKAGISRWTTDFQGLPVTYYIAPEKKISTFPG